VFSRHASAVRAAERDGTLFAYAYVFAYMSSTSIRLSKEAKARLDRLKRAGESYEDVIMRLTERDRWAGFGVLSEVDSDTRDGMTRMREEMREGVTEDVEN
jgi:predicted CopG family antitoxin